MKIRHWIDAWWPFIKDRIYNYDKEVLKGDIIDLRHFHGQTLQPTISPGLLSCVKVLQHPCSQASACGSMLSFTCPLSKQAWAKRKQRQLSLEHLPLSPQLGPRTFAFTQEAAALSGPVVCMMTWLELATCEEFCIDPAPLSNTWIPRFPSPSVDWNHFFF